MSYKGNQLQEIMKDAQNGVEPAINELSKAPQLDPDYKLYWHGFHDLSTCRNIGMSSGPIPLTAIFAYTQFYPFTEEEAHEFVRVIRLVDVAYMEIVAERAERQERR